MLLVTDMDFYLTCHGVNFDIKLRKRQQAVRLFLKGYKFTLIYATLLAAQFCAQCANFLQARF